MKTHFFLAALTLSIVVGAPAHGQEKNDLLGHWEAPCEFFGNPANCTQTWRPGLHGELLVMEYRVFAADDGRQIFAGDLDLKQEDHHLRGYWIDSRGVMEDVHAELNERALESHWGSPTSEQGRSRYSLSDSGELLVSDWVLTEDGWHEFMTASYSRSIQSGAQQD